MKKGKIYINLEFSQGKKTNQYEMHVVMNLAIDHCL